MKIFSLLFLTLLISLSAKGLHKDTLTFSEPAFSENKGQWPENVLFKAKIAHGNLWVERNCLTFDIQNGEDLKRIADYKRSYGRNKKAGKKLDSRVRRHVYKIHFENSNTSILSEGKDIHYDYENYFIGNDPTKWASRVQKYSYVFLYDIYPNIDLKLYEKDGFLKWDFIVKPKGKVEDILLRYEGIDKLNISNGNLVLKTLAGKIVESKPYAYQFNGAIEESIECQYYLDKNTLKFRLKSTYNTQTDLIIDPTLVYASYTGSHDDNWGYTATYDNSGNIIAGGAVFNTSALYSYPTTVGALDSTFNGGVCDISITKFDPTNSNLLFSTYLGGSGSEVPSSLVVNSNDELLILSTTGSSDFPMHTNAYDNTFGGGTAIILTSLITFSNGSDLAFTRLSADGTQLLGSTYFGGSGNDGMNSAANLDANYADKIRGEILTDKNNNVIVVSSTYSSNLPTNSSSYQSVPGGGQEGLIIKMDNNLSNLIWCSYLGGSSHDALYSVSLFKNDDLVVTGGTKSMNLNTTPNAIYPTYQGGTTDGFIASMNKNGSQIYNLTYYGSAGYDQSYFVDTDRKDNVYVYGQTNDTSHKFIYNAQWSTIYGGQFVSKLAKNLQSVVWSTEWGTGAPIGDPEGPDISPSAFMVDLCNRVYMSGWGGLTNYFGFTTGLPVTPNAFQSTTDGSDYYFITLLDDASAIDYATFYGGTWSSEHVDGGTSRFDQSGKLYQSVCAGCGGYSDFPTTSGCHSANNLSGNCNNAVIKFSFNVPVILADFDPPSVGCAPYQINFTNTSTLISSGSNCHWDFGNGATSNQCNPSYTYNQGGIYNVRLIVSDTGSCNLADTIVKQVAVIEGHRDTLPVHKICVGEITQIGLLPVNDPNISYIWNNASSLSNPNISNPIASPTSSTWFTLLFSNGVCTDTLVQLVKVYDVQADAGNDTSLCFSNITLTAHGNYPSLKYQWSSNIGFSDTLNSSLSDSTLTTTIAGSTMFYVKISHTASCYEIDSIKVDPRIVIDTNQVQNPACNGDSNGAISLNVIGVNPPLSYLWSNGSTQASLSQVPAGNYTVTVTDQDGCFAIKNIVLSEPPPLTALSAVRNIPCKEACIGEAWSTPVGGTPPYQWLWNDATSQTTNPANNLCDGTYKVTITDAHQCTTYDTIQIIDSSIYITTNATIAYDTIYEGQSAQINSNFYTPGYTYTWTPAIGLNNPSIHNPLASPTESTLYRLLLQDIYGCEWEDSVFIYVIDVICEDPFIYVPNAFTPDGDGKNDIFYVRSSVGYDMEFRIYNRWGEKVFESNNINHGWDGTYKGRKLEPAVFDYYLKLTCYNRQVFIKKGNITLIR